MKKNLVLSFLLMVAALWLTSCSAPKNIAYIKNSDWTDLSKSAYLYDAHIMPKDVLTITVNTVNPEASAPFNLTMSSSSSNSSSGGSLLTYLVDNNGTIEFPVLGQLKVVGLTKSECEKMIHDKIKPYLNVNEHPVVTVRMTNYKITVLGEVNSPGMFTVTNEKINIFEALAQAGDLTIYGVRDNVKLIREDANGKKEVHTIVLNDVNLVSSPYYYLQQNDILYVEPNSVKAKNSTVGQTTTLWFSATSILISLTSLLFNILR